MRPFSVRFASFLPPYFMSDSPSLVDLLQGIEPVRLRRQRHMIAALIAALNDESSGGKPGPVFISDRQLAKAAELMKQDGALVTRPAKGGMEIAFVRYPHDVAWQKETVGKFPSELSKDELKEAAKKKPRGKFLI